MNRKQKIILISLASLIVVGITTTLIIRSVRKKKGVVKNKLKKDSTLVCSHIGSYDGENDVNAENQLENIKKLIDKSIDMVEIDVQITKDGVPVLYHDATLDSKTNGSGKIQDKTWADLSKVRYDKDKSAGISKLKDVTDYLKKKKSKTILQLDKTSSEEISKINSLGIFKGIEGNILCKGQSFTKPKSVIDSKVMWMPIIPSDYVGRMNKESVIEEIVNKSKGSQFLEAQFSDEDTLLINGTLSKELSKNGCRLLIVSVAGSQKTNGKSFRGDSKAQWVKMINPMKAGVIMTNYPLKLQKYIQENE